MGRWEREKKGMGKENGNGKRKGMGWDGMGCSVQRCAGVGRKCINQPWPFESCVMIQLGAHVINIIVIIVMIVIIVIVIIMIILRMDGSATVTDRIYSRS
jgi:hypothetical protein